MEDESYNLMAGLEHTQQAGTNKAIAAQAAGRYPPCLSAAALAERARRLSRRASVGGVSTQLHDYLSKAVERHLTTLLQRAFAAAALREGDAQRCVVFCLQCVCSVFCLQHCWSIAHVHLTRDCRRREQHSELTTDPRRGILQESSVAKRQRQRSDGVQRRQRGQTPLARAARSRPGRWKRQRQRRAPRWLRPRRLGGVASGHRGALVVQVGAWVVCCAGTLWYQGAVACWVASRCWAT